MANDGFVQVPPDSTGKKIDNSELTVGVNLVERQRTVLSDDADPVGLAKIQASDPMPTDYGLTVRQVNPLPGDQLTTQTGPFIQAKVDETPNSYIDTEIRPLSLTREGRLRVSTIPADINQCWQRTFENPWSGIWWMDDNVSFTYRENK